MNNQISVPVSPGEVIDKITILEIKREFISDKEKLVHINHEFKLLMDVFNLNFGDVQGINELKSKYTIVVVTHNMHQAARISQRTAIFHIGKLIEFDETDKIFTSPSKQKTNDYITGRYG